MNKQATQELIDMFEETLKRYREQLCQNPGSTFYHGLVKNTEEHIEELKEHLTRTSIPVSNE